MSEFTISPELTIELNVKCQNQECAHYFDLLSLDGYNEDGDLIKQACGDGVWSDNHDNFKLDVKCPECNELMHLQGINW